MWEYAPPGFLPSVWEYAETRTFCPSWLLDPNAFGLRQSRHRSGVTVAHCRRCFKVQHEPSVVKNILGGITSRSRDFFCFVLKGSHRKGTSPSSQLTFPYFLLNSAVTDWPVVCVCVCAPCHILTVKNDNASFRFHNVIWICQSRSICCHFAGADGRPRQHSSVFFLLMEVQEIAIWLHFGFPTDFLLCMHLFFFFSLPHPNWNSGKL